MEKGNLPIEKAIEPNEEACQPLTQDESMTPILAREPTKKLIIFADNSDNEAVSQKSRSYQIVLSQPAPNISHRQRLEWLQKRRKTGLWAQCDECARWRFLPHVLDSYELPQKWYCHMNPDHSVANCSVPETSISVREEEDMIHAEYSAGSIVWAHIVGWPWWPAMVVDCPDTEQYYWLDGFSDIPTHYHVVFFDTEVTRSWLAPEQLKSYKAHKNSFNDFFKNMKYKDRLQIAAKQADDALNLSLEERLEKYSFLTRYKGNFNTPKKVTNTELKKQKKTLKRKFNIQFECSDSDETLEPRSVKKNVIIVGTHKSPSTRAISKDNEVEPTAKENTKSAKEITEKTGEAKSKESETLGWVKHEDIIEPNTEASIDTSNKANSLAVQIGSYVESALVEETFDNDTSKTYVPEDEPRESSPLTQDDTVTSRRDIQVIIDSPDSNHSDEFEF